MLWHFFETRDTQTRFLVVVVVVFSDPNRKAPDDLKAMCRGPAAQWRRQLLLLLLLLASHVRKALGGGAYESSVAPSKQNTGRPKIEIRVQDFSFSVEGPKEHQVVEIEARDMTGSEIYNALLAMSMEKENANEDVMADEEPEPNDQLSNQDTLLLMFVILCAARLLLFMAASIWKLLRRVAGLKEPDLIEESNEVIRVEMTAKQTAVIRLCHLQFLVLAEKLKQELSGSNVASGDEEVVGQMIASLPASQLNKDNVRLSDILQILEQIPLKEHGLSNATIEEQMAAIHDDLEENDLDIAGAWTRLQALYSSFQAIQQAIRNRAKQRAQRSQSVAETMRERSYTEDVLGELRKVTPTLPQGFTADMFASLGHAIHQQQQEQTTMSHRIARYPSDLSETDQTKND